MKLTHFAWLNALVHIAGLAFAWLMRDGTVLFDGEGAVGTVTSGGFGPSVEAPVAMAYVPSALSPPGTRLAGAVRGTRLPVTIADRPFFSPSSNH